MVLQNRQRSALFLFPEIASFVPLNESEKNLLHDNVPFPFSAVPQSIRAAGNDFRNGADGSRNSAAHLRNDAGNFRNSAAHLRNGAGGFRNSAAHLRNGAAYLRNCAGHLRNGAAHLRTDADAGFMTGCPEL